MGIDMEYIDGGGGEERRKRNLVVVREFKHFSPPPLFSSIVSVLSSSFPSLYAYKPIILLLSLSSPLSLPSLPPLSPSSLSFPLLPSLSPLFLILPFSYSSSFPSIVASSSSPPARMFGPTRDSGSGPNQGFGQALDRVKGNF